MAHHIDVVWPYRSMGGMDISDISEDWVERSAPSMLRALSRIVAPTGFPHASAGGLFKDAYFGRDALEVAEDLLPIRPDIARATILELARLQGRTLDPRTEEEPGKIHHEYRALTIDGYGIGAASRQIFRQLATQWNLAHTEAEMNALQAFTYYGTVDATPLYVRLVARYCSLFGHEILDEEYRPMQAGNETPALRIRDSVQAALDWVLRRLDSSELGLLEFQRMVPHGHPFQAWKDGRASYIHPDGRLANADAPIASIEVQGLAYDALVAAPDLLGGATQHDRGLWLSKAERLQRAVMERFWMPDERYFAMALDRDPANGTPRQVKLIASNPGALLDSSIFDTLHSTERQDRVSAVVTRLMSDEFLTPAGIRTTSLIHKDVLDYAAYQSSYTVWHKETFDFARGLRRQGLPHLADEIETRLLNAINIVGEATEFLYVTSDDSVDYDPFDNVPREGAREIVCSDVPENDQAWSISAALAIKWRRGRRENRTPHVAPWQPALEDACLARISETAVLRSVNQIREERRTSPPLWINREEGRRRDLAAALS